MSRRASLITRLTAFHALVSAAVLMGVIGIIAAAVDRHFEELDRAALEGKHHLIEEIVATAASVVELQARLEDAMHAHHGLHVRIDEPAGKPLFSTSPLAFPSGSPAGAARAAQALIFTWQSDGRTYRVLSARSAPWAPAGGPLHIGVALDTEHHVHFIADLQRTLWIYAALAVLISGVLGWWAARTGLSPLRAMRARAQAVTAHTLDARMPAQAVPVEMAQLAMSLNDMLARLQADFQRLSEFSSDLAHELRTPISNLLTQTQVALAQPRDADAYREILASNAEEFQRLARMVADMLFLAKTEHGLTLPSRDAVALADEVQGLFEFYEVLADEQRVRLQLVGAGRVEGDRLMLRRAIGNLLSNALRHTPAGGEVHVEIRETPDAVELAVDNTGADIPAELLPRLFDRFFRADRARAHPQAEGAGLGLSITRAIAHAHGGTVSVASGGGRTRFVLHFPRGAAARP